MTATNQEIFDLVSDTRSRVLLAIDFARSAPSRRDIKFWARTAIAEAIKLGIVNANDLVYWYGSRDVNLNDLESEVETRFPSLRKFELTQYDAKKELPDDERQVLVTNGRFFDVAYYNASLKGWEVLLMLSNEVLYWYDLPLLPKVKEG